MNSPLPIGSKVPQLGEVIDVWDWPMKTDGTMGRTYVLRNDQGLAFKPASVVERQKEVTK
jgi:hypothetical protein